MFSMFRNEIIRFFRCSSLALEASRAEQPRDSQITNLYCRIAPLSVNQANELYTEAQGC